MTKFEILSEQIIGLTPAKTRPLSNDETTKVLDSVTELSKHPTYSNVAKSFLAAYEEGGNLWEWGIDPIDFAKKSTRHGYSYGWWVVRADKIVASLCYSFS